jgi:hypothetical protein
VNRSDHGERKRDAAGHPSSWGAGSSLKAVGLAVAWTGGVACGWRVFLESNLLDAVLRGAGAWLALTVLWMAGISFCERYVLCFEERAQSSASDESETAEARGEARR